MNRRLRACRAWWPSTLARPLSWPIPRNLTLERVLQIQLSLRSLCRLSERLSKGFQDGFPLCQEVSHQYLQSDLIPSPQIESTWNVCPISLFTVVHLGSLMRKRPLTSSILTPFLWVPWNSWQRGEIDDWHFSHCDTSSYSESMSPISPRHLDALTLHESRFVNRFQCSHFIVNFEIGLVFLALGPAALFRGLVTWGRTLRDWWAGLVMIFFIRLLFHFIHF